MTTSALQHCYRDVYSQFYGEHDLVISLPFQFRWAHDMPAGSESLIIKQKLPTKLYLGLTPLGRPGVFFGTCTSFSPTQGIITERIDEVISLTRAKNLTDFLQETLKNYGYTKGVHIDILTEQMKGYGFGFMGIFTTALACSVHLLSNKLSGELVADYETFKGDPLRKEIISLTHEIDIAGEGFPSGLTARYALSRTPEPMIQFGSTTILGKDGKRKSCTTPCVSVTLSKFTGIAFDEIMMPIDYGILSFGQEYEGDETRRSTVCFDQVYKETLKYYKQQQKSLHLPAEMDMPSRLPVLRTNKYLKISLLKHRQEMLQHPLQDKYIESFIQSIADLGAHAILIEKQKQQLLDIYAQFHFSKRFPTENIALAPMSTIKTGGSILFVCNRSKSRQTLNRMLEGLHHQGYHDAQLTYLSWRDGMCGDGLNIEQWLSRKQYSFYVSPGSAVMVEGNGHRSVINHQELIESEEKIILDQIYGKMRLANKKLTHKEVPSQSGTVEIISALLEHKGKYIHNSQLPTSSYSKNKNEMVGKIIQPLTRLVKDHFGHQLEIECKGNIFDFSMRLKNDGDLFCLVKQLGK